MSDAHILLGHISEALPKYQPDDPLFFRKANDAALNELPADDSMPPLIRPLFSVTGDDARHGSWRDQRLIYFAMHHNKLSDWYESRLGVWLDKFEPLLRRLYWLDARVVVFTGWSGPSLVLEYSVSKETVLQYYEQAPRPPQDWVLRAYYLRTEEAGGGELADCLGKGRVVGDPERDGGGSADA